MCFLLPTHVSLRAAHQSKALKEKHPQVWRMSKNAFGRSKEEQRFINTKKSLKKALRTPINSSPWWDKQSKHFPLLKNIVY